MNCDVNYTAHLSPKRATKRGSREIGGDNDPQTHCARITWAGLPSGEIQHLVAESASRLILSTWAIYNVLATKTGEQI